MKVSCVCDLCSHGTEDRRCYMGGIKKCLKNGVYKYFELKQETDWKSRYEELNKYVKDKYGDY